MEAEASEGVHYEEENGNRIGTFDNSVRNGFRAGFN